MAASGSGEFDANLDSSLSGACQFRSSELEGQAFFGEAQHEDFEIRTFYGWILKVPIGSSDGDGESTMILCPDGAIMNFPFSPKGFEARVSSGMDVNNPKKIHIANRWNNEFGRTLGETSSTKNARQKIEQFESILHNLKARSATTDEVSTQNAFLADRIFQRMLQIYSSRFLVL